MVHLVRSSSIMYWVIHISLSQSTPERASSGNSNRAQILVGNAPDDLVDSCQSRVPAARRLLRGLLFPGLISISGFNIHFI